MTRLPLSDLDLHAYLDHALEHDPERKAAVEAGLDADPELAARLAAYGRQTIDMIEDYRAVFDSPVPDRLFAVLDSDRRPPRVRFFRNMAAACALLVMGMLGGTVVDELPAADDLTVQDMVRVVEADDLGDPLATPVARSGELPSPDAPDLQALGFVVEDTDQVSIDDHPALRVTYRGADGRTVDLLIQEGRQPEATVRYLENGRRKAIFWTEAPVAYGLIADGDREDLAALVAHIRASLDGAMTAPPALEPAPLPAAIPTFTLKESRLDFPAPTERRNFLQDRTGIPASDR